MEKNKVVAIGNISPLLLEKLQEKCEVKLWDKTDRIPQELLCSWLEDADGLISRGDITLDDALLSHAPKLRVIAQSSVGYDNVDIDACTKHKIPFGNTPGVLVEATADLTFGLVLSSARRIHEGWDYVRNGQWNSSYNIPFGVDLYGKTLGIAGMGNIGKSVAKRAKASGMNIIYHNRTQRKENNLLATYVSFERLLEESDFLVVLIPLTAESKGLFGKEQFARMKSTSYFINASRGSIVDTQALYEALVNKEIAYAALDVTDPEPINVDHPIMTLNNILITPHIGSATYETRMRMASLTVDNLLAGLEGKSLPACVNETVNYSG